MDLIDSISSTNIPQSGTVALSGFSYDILEKHPANAKAVDKPIAVY